MSVSVSVDVLDPVRMVRVAVGGGVSVSEGFSDPERVWLMEKLSASEPRDNDRVAVPGDADRVGGGVRVAVISTLSDREAGVDAVSDSELLGVSDPPVTE
jgi:hypothetical protein